MLGIPLWSVVKEVGRNFFFMCKILVYFQWDSTKVTALPTGQKRGEIGRMSLTREGFGVKLNRARGRTKKGEICTIFTSNFPTVVPVLKTRKSKQPEQNPRLCVRSAELHFASDTLQHGCGCKCTREQHVLVLRGEIHDRHRPKSRRENIA